VATHRKLGPVLATIVVAGNMIGPVSPVARHARRGRRRHHHRLVVATIAQSHWRCCSANSRDFNHGVAPLPTYSIRSTVCRMQASPWYWTSCLIGNVANAAAAGLSGCVLWFDRGSHADGPYHHRSDVAEECRQHGESAVRRFVQRTLLIEALVPLPGRHVGWFMFDPAQFRAN
jgi:hypothetical protein